MTSRRLTRRATTAALLSAPGSRRPPGQATALVTLASVATLPQRWRQEAPGGSEMTTQVATDVNRAVQGGATPKQVLESVVDGINTRNLDALMRLYEPHAAFAAQPGSLAHGLSGVRASLAAFIAMNGTLALEVTRVLEADDLALVVGA